ncbi:pectinesterase-like [Dioscorea cayenensis subsp. rotundata]|uniref:Pectinesterase n=1 Tax=Dioscorea cayennensis subsp. rotundata TaxID=55577 RepID=A0AB40BM15_DIOCR|nr:pectinesterase-like [Dioscorea cayenensis subsp. rotundata]
MAKKKLVVIGGSVILLVAAAAVIAITLTESKSNANSSTSSSKNSGSFKTSVKSIQAICHPTDYKQTCEQTLTAAAGNITDPKGLVKLAFQITSDRIQQALKRSTVLLNAEKDPLSVRALKDCREVFGYAVQDLQDTIDRFSDFDITKIDDMVDDIKVWLSAVVTYQESCLDGFLNVTSNAGQSMASALNISKQMTSNALAMVDGLGSLIGSISIPQFNRRLLAEATSGEFPSWLSAGGRSLLGVSPLRMKPAVTVAKDGSGDFKTINEALQGVPRKTNTSYYVIYVKEGVYDEYVEISKDMINVFMIGDGQTKTRITGHKNYVDGITTFKTASMAVIGDGFLAKDIGIENTAGPEKHQAVALRVSGDRSVFYQCQMDGYQDTLYAYAKRQFYRDCTISGTVDFIFGDSPSVFQNCKMVVRRPMDNQQNIVTAQGRKDRHQPSGIIIHQCKIVADSDLHPVRQTIKSYLGRPWKQYSRTLIIQTEIDDLIAPEGWLPWEGDFALRTCLYAELDNFGAGSGKDKRVKWRGIKKVNYSGARKYSVERFLQGNRWLPATGVPYVADLVPQ